MNSDIVMMERILLIRELMDLDDEEHRYKVDPDRQREINLRKEEIRRECVRLDFKHKEIKL